MKDFLDFSMIFKIYFANWLVMVNLLIVQIKLKFKNLKIKAFIEPQN
jgi:hypothetical protein